MLFRSSAPLLTSKRLNAPLLPTYKFVLTSQRVPGSVRVTELPFALVAEPMKPWLAPKTLAPLLTIIWLLALNAPTSRSSALLHTEPAPVIKARLLVAGGLTP